MKNKLKGLLFRLPVAILIVAGFFGSIYAKINNIAPVRNYAPAIIFLILAVLYSIGEYYSFKHDHHLF